MIPIVGIIVGVATVVAAAPAEFYQSRYDHIDIQSILNNRRMVNHYAACLLSQGACPPQGLDLKRILPEALETNCGKCTEKQKTTAYRTIKRLQKEYPKIWSQLLAVWDPDEVFVRKFVSSFESEKPSVPVKQPAQSPFLSNRFGENEDSGSVSPATSSPPPPSSTTVRTTTSTTTTTTTTTAATKRTNKPSFVFVTNPPQAPPFTTVGANIQATVSFGTNLVGGIVRSLGTLGTRVVESGTKLANMVISTVLRP